MVNLVSLIPASMLFMILPKSQKKAWTLQGDGEEIPFFTLCNCVCAHTVFKNLILKGDKSKKLQH